MKNRIEKDKTVIPKGAYCYSGDYVCPYWDIKTPPEKEMDEDEYYGIAETEEINDIYNCGYCHFLEQWDLDTGGLLWDQCKECGINEEP